MSLSWPFDIQSNWKYRHSLLLLRVFFFYKIIYLLSASEDARVLVANKNEIAFADHEAIYNPLRRTLSVPGAHALAGIDVYMKERKLFFSDSQTMKIYSMSEDGSNLTEVCYFVTQMIKSSCGNVLRRLSHVSTYGLSELLGSIDFPLSVRRQTSFAHPWSVNT